MRFYKRANATVTSPTVDANTFLGPLGWSGRGLMGGWVRTVCPFPSRDLEVRQKLLLGGECFRFYMARLVRLVCPTGCAVGVQDYFYHFPIVNTPLRPHTMQLL
jgi:hypothetical protein